VRSCYLEAASHAPADVPLSVPVWFTTDEAAAVHDGGLGAQTRASLSYWVMHALRHVRSDQRPDTGMVRVAADLRFQAALAAAVPPH
jgi:hypothetical protein